MLSGLKKARVTFQRKINIVFIEQIGRNIEVVKSQKADEHVKDKEEVFNILRMFGVKLNLKKCVFGITVGNFLGFMVSQRSIEDNLEKIKAILDMQPLSMAKAVQILMGIIVTLNRLLPRFANRRLPFFRLLRNIKNFEWTKKCQKLLDELKKYLSSPPLLA